MLLADKINLAIAIASVLSAVASFAVVLATFRILRANQETVEVMRAQTRSLSRPYVQVTPVVRTGSTMVMLVIRNSGTTAALNLKLTLDKDVHFNGEERPGRNLREFSAFVRPMSSLPPMAELSFHLGVGHVLMSNSEKFPLQFAVTAEYQFDSERVTETTNVDLEPYRLTAMPVEPVAEQLQKLVHVGEQIAKHLREV